MIRKMLSVMVVVLTVGCTPSDPPVTEPPIYGQMLPRTLCSEFDFSPIVEALNVGTPTGNPLYDGGGIENRWYSCSIRTLNKEASDVFHYTQVSIGIGLYGTPASAEKDYDKARQALTTPTDFPADSVTRAVKDIQPSRDSILILDRNLVLQLNVEDLYGSRLRAAVEGCLEDLAQDALATVRTRATPAAA